MSNATKYGTATINVGEDGEVVGVSLKGGPLYQCTAEAFPAMQDAIRGFGFVAVVESNLSDTNLFVVWIVKTNE